jgi:hypothetical protein
MALAPQRASEECQHDGIAEFAAQSQACGLGGFIAVILLFALGMTYSQSFQDGRHGAVTVADMVPVLLFGLMALPAGMYLFIMLFENEPRARR